MGSQSLGLYNALCLLMGVIICLREGEAMREVNFIMHGQEHVERPAEGLSSTGAPGQPPRTAHALAAARGHHTRSRPPCTCRRADSSSHPSCLRRTLSGEFLGSNHPS